MSDYETLQVIWASVEIQIILYSSAERPRQILQLDNITFKHFILLKQSFGNDLKTVTIRKLFRKYFHNLMTHASIQYRIIAGSSINCEDEERIFNLITSITITTSSHHLGNVIGNLILRYQAENKLLGCGRALSRTSVLR